MRRRQYVITTGSVVVFAGRYAVDQGTSEDGGMIVHGNSPTSDAGDRAPDEIGAQTTESPTDDSGGSGPEIVLGEPSLSVEDDGVTVSAYVDVDVSNVGDAPSGWITLDVWWYNEAGDLLDSDTHFLYTLGPGEVWSARIYHLGSDSDQVADFDLQGDYEVEGPTPPPDGVELLESELRVGDRSAEIVGRVRNESGGELSYIEAIGKVYDEMGVVLGSEWTNETDVPNDTTWRFDMSWLGRERVDLAADHAVVLTHSSL